MASGPNKPYDIVTVGGGLGGASLAKAMAEAGARVLVLEREPKFKDRVRGEALMPWGVAEARQLGIYDLLLPIGHEVTWWNVHVGPIPVIHRNLPMTTPQRFPLLTFFHPQMQERLLRAAREAGADVHRKARVREVIAGSPAKVAFEEDGHARELSCRLVVGADGRGSMVRRWAGFELQEDPDFLMICGVLFERMPAEEEAAYIAINYATSTLGLLFPQGKGRVRAYLVFHRDAGTRFQGTADLGRFIDASVESGVPKELFAGAQPSGPLATFRGADSFVAHPYRNGLALIGDAAAASDPTWGQGLSLTLRDVRTLRDCLLADSDWDRAGHAYALEHDRYYGIDHTVSNWTAQLFFERGPEAEARRQRALPLIAQDASRLPDANLSGPDSDVDEGIRRRLFGEE